MIRTLVPFSRYRVLLGHVFGHYGWTEWGEWTACSQSCDEGTSVRYRICTHQLAAARNQTCVGTGNEIRNCSIEPCAVNGQWSDWSGWGICSVTCENGTHIRHRKCTNPVPQYDGTNCTGNDLEIKECSEQPCPVDGEWCWRKVYKCSYLFIKYNISNNVDYERTFCGCPFPSNGGKTLHGGWCTEQIYIMTCTQFSGDISGDYSVPMHNAKIRSTCSCPAPRYGGEQCKQ